MTAEAESRAGWHSLQWWPTLAGIAFAAFVALDPVRGPVRGAERGSDLAPIVAASGLVYLAAAALQKRSAAWPAFFVSVVVITIVKMAAIDIDPTWPLIGLAALLAGYGLLGGAARPAGSLPIQAIAMVGFGAIAAIALFLDDDAGAYLVALGLFAHAGWDVYHHRADKVVTRSLAEFCFVLDVLLALAIIVVTLRS